MAMIGVHQVRSLTRERYEEVVRRLTKGKSASSHPPISRSGGLLVHGAGTGKHGFFVIDVFASEEAVRAFEQAVGSIPRDVGIKEGPDFFPAHTFYSDLR